ncbi:MAG TPA: DUF4197 domain-containing protein [Verrucomicrobiae bacterium]|nr:DUF4197 domain-containing protein [Verrucomicrobiae bacterium]
MNKKAILTLTTACLLAGCSKKEEPAATAPSKPTAAAPVPVVEKPESKPAPVAQQTPAVAPVVPAAPVAAAPVPATTAPVPVAVQEPPKETPPPAPVTLPPAAAAPPATSTATVKSTAESIAKSLLASATPATKAEPAATSSAATPQSSSALSLADLSTDQVTRGLKEALGKGLQTAINSLGKTGGFLTNLDVKIPMPEKLKTVEKTLRSLRQDQLADEFVTTMNRAAEQAVPAAAEVFAGSLKQMTVEDAKNILSGPPDAATQYFRRTTGAELAQKFEPIVSKATTACGATAAYKQLMDKAKLAGPFLNTQNLGLDLDAYVTDKAMDGLFKMVASEEKRIRENPVARSTELLKSVFGALKR